jgi:hypothetical protein
MTDTPFDPAKVAGLANRTFRAPDLTQAVEGWRAWKVKPELPPFGLPPKLHSVTYSDCFWEPRKLARASCLFDEEHNAPDTIPVEECTCGFYAAKDLDHLLGEMGYARYDIEDGWIRVVGQLALWGKVIEGSQGWRAEYGYPVRIFVPFEAAHLGVPLRKAYGVPVTLKNWLQPRHEEEN